MNTHQTDDVIAGYRKATDAQQQIIQELRLEIASLTRGNETMHKLIDEQLAEIANLKAGGCARNQGSTQFCAEAVQLQGQMRHMVRIDDPVVTGLVGELRNFEQTCYSRDNYLQAHKALSAYEARVKSIEVPLQNHGRLNIDYKYNNETTTMSPARVKEVGK